MVFRHKWQCKEVLIAYTGLPRYISDLYRSALFHHPENLWPEIPMTPFQILTNRLTTSSKDCSTGTSYSVLQEVQVWVRKKEAVLVVSTTVGFEDPLRWDARSKTPNGPAPNSIIHCFAVHPGVGHKPRGNRRKRIYDILVQSTRGDVKQKAAFGKRFRDMLN